MPFIPHTEEDVREINEIMSGIQAIPLTTTAPVATTPPRVGSRMTCIDDVTASMAAVSALSGAVSLAIVVSNSMPSRLERTATP